MTRCTIALLLALGALACQYNPFAHEFTHDKPSANEIVGVYRLDQESRNMLRGRFKIEPPQATFTLNADGTFEIRDIPSCWRIDNTCTTKTEDASGTWQIGEDQEWWSVRLRCTKLSGRGDDYGIPAKIRGDKAPRLLHFTVGDPDAGEALAFQRVDGAT